MVFVSGREDDLSYDARSFSVTAFDCMVKLFIAAK